MKRITALIFTLIFLGHIQQLWANQFIYSDHIKEVRLLSQESHPSIKTKKQLNSALQKQRKQSIRMSRYTLNLGSWLEETLAKNDELIPYQLNLIHETFKAQIKVEKQTLSLLQRTQRKVSQRDSDEENHYEWVLLAITQLENYKKIHDLFFLNTTLRRILEDQASVDIYGISSLEGITNKILNKKRILFIEKQLRKVSFSEHQQEIKQMASYQLILQERSLIEFSQRGLFFPLLLDGLNNFSSTITAGLSQAFGSVAGNISWRDGYLKGNQDVLLRLKEKLLPFDILMEKRGYKLTDYTIPGHWGHAGVYLGTKQQLQEHGLWNTPSLRPFHKKIEAGYVIFQVRRWGLEWVKLIDFLDLDEMAVLRINSLLKKESNEKEMMISNLMAQNGKKYDYSFDAMSSERITCTEIIALSYGNIKWPTDRVLGRSTISPDNLAELTFYHNSPLALEAYITADEKNTYWKQRDDFARAINYVPNPTNEAPNFLKKEKKCHRTIYRHRRKGIRIKLKCNDILKEQYY